MKLNHEWRDTLTVFAATGILAGSLIGACIGGSPFPEIGAGFFAIVGAFVGQLMWERRSE